MAPVTAPQFQVIDEVVLVQETLGAEGAGTSVVQVADSVPDQPAVLPACTCRVSWLPPERLLWVLDVPVCSTHDEYPRNSPR